MSEIDYNSRDLQTSLMRLQEENARLKRENATWIGVAEKFSLKSKKLEYELEYLKLRIWQIKKSIKDEGPNPKYHKKIMKKHRSEWPSLWAGIDKLVEYHDKNI